MAFKLAKASGVRVPDMVDHIPADDTTVTIDTIVNGSLVQIVAGELALADTAGQAVAGILVNEAGDSRYAAPGSEVYTSTFKNLNNVTFIPVTTTVLIEADFVGAATPVIGADYDLSDETAIDVDASVSDDFRVVNFKYDAAGAISKLLGFFANPGYFVS